jgi:hypothetical protein
MGNISTKQITPEEAAELVSQIIRSGDDEAARALATLLNALVDVESRGAREGIAIEASERAYRMTDEFGNSLLAFMRGDRTFAVSDSGGVRLT